MKTDSITLLITIPVIVESITYLSRNIFFNKFIYIRKNAFLDLLNFWFKLVLLHFSGRFLGHFLCNSLICHNYLRLNLFFVYMVLTSNIHRFDVCICLITATLTTFYLQLPLTIILFLVATYAFPEEIAEVTTFTSLHFHIP